MSRPANAVFVFCLGAIAALNPPASRAAAISSTQTAVLPPTSTNFTAGSANVSPLVLNKFDTQNGSLVLDSVDLSFHAKVTNQFSMTFPTNGPSTITTSVATGDAGTPGPTITMFQPDGLHPLLTVKAANDPAFLTRAVSFKPTSGSSNVFSSTLDSKSPNYIAPATTEASNALHLTSPSDLALFTGKGFVGLPVSAQAFSSFVSSSGNGFGKVTTSGSADVTVSYQWHAQTPAPQVTTPEPASVVLWGIVGAGLAAGLRARRKRA